MSVGRHEEYTMRRNRLGLSCILLAVPFLMFGCQAGSGMSTSGAGAGGTTGGVTGMSRGNGNGVSSSGGAPGAGGTSRTGGAPGSGGAPGTGGGTPAPDAGSADGPPKDASVADMSSPSDGSTSRDAVSGPACSLAPCATCAAGKNLNNANNDNWAGSLTLFISYSSNTKTQTVDTGFTSAQWNAAVNSFNVPAFATQVQATGAKSIIFMISQNTGFYASPNAAYDRYAGLNAGDRCSLRDLPMEIADALAPMGIGMYLYLPEDVGWGDTKTANAFGLTTKAQDNWVVDGTFLAKWNAVIKEWADRYRTKARGWFFDGYDPTWGVTEAMARTYRTTVLTANPCGVVSFNGGSITQISDTIRGETRMDATTGLPAMGLPTTRWHSGLQNFWAFPLQSTWGQSVGDDSPAVYTNANLNTFITAAIKSQVVFALDVRTSLAGRLSTPIYDQLLTMKKEIGY
jgi:hypothetical protein